MICKVGISMAFRHIKVDPNNYNKLSLKWDNQFFSTSLPFGFRLRSTIFLSVSDAVCFIMRQKNHYIDNLIGVGLWHLGN